jgi:hypothetical protein
LAYLSKSVLRMPVPDFMAGIGRTVTPIGQ